MIRLDNGYAIEVDSNCYTLGIPKMTNVVNKKTGEETEKEVLTEPKYYTTLGATLLGYWKIMRRKGLAGFEGSLKESLDMVEKMDTKIIELIDRVEEGAVK